MWLLTRKGSIVVECGNALLKKRLQGQDSEHHQLQKSMHYNPFAYVHSEKDILKLVTTLMTNTKVKGPAGTHFGRNRSVFCLLP